MTATFVGVTLGLLVVFSILVERRKHKAWRSAWEATRLGVY